MLVVTILGIDASPQGTFNVDFKVVASGSYATGGDTLNFSTAAPDPTFQGANPYIPFGGLGPVSLAINSAGGLLGYGYIPVIGANPAICKMKVNSIATLGTELSAGAYPSAVIADTIVGRAVFSKWA